MCDKQTFMVTLLPPKGRRIKVIATYYRIDDVGNLVFRNEAEAGKYPTMVRLFARGTWRDVENASV